MLCMLFGLILYFYGWYFVICDTKYAFYIVNVSGVWDSFISRIYSQTSRLCVYHVLQIFHKTVWKHVVLFCY